MVNQTINLFVSYYHDDGNMIDKFKGFLVKKSLNVRDSSIYGDRHQNQANNEEYIKSIIRPQIDWAGSVAVLIGKETADSNWVKWEIQYATNHDKNLVGVMLPGTSSSDIPRDLRDASDAILSWGDPLIAEAILGEFHSWKDKEGKNYLQGMTVKRASC